MNRFVMITFMLTAVGLLLAQHAGAEAFFEDFKDNGANFTDGFITYNWDDGEMNMEAEETRTGELLEARTTANGHWYNAYNWDYPKVGTITWDTTQHRYLQAWVPWHNESDFVTFAVSIDGEPFVGEHAGMTPSAPWPDGVTAYWTSAFNNTWYYWNTQPDIKDLNDMAQLTPGVHELRFRFFILSSSNYGEDTATLGASIDWIRGGMPPDADISIAQSIMTTGVSGQPGFVGPADMAVTGNPPTLEWTAPAEQTNLKYSVSYSQDPYFRGPTTVSVHNIDTTSYTPAAELADGIWYWTVIAVTSEGIAGQAMVKSEDLANYSRYWAECFQYYSFEVNAAGPNSAQCWSVYQ